MEDLCIVCGKTVVEGTQVCPNHATPEDIGNQIHDVFAKRNKYGETTTKVAIHKSICAELTDIYIKKNHDYGDSFAKMRKELPNSILVRIYDKYSRLKTLMSGAEQKVKNESIEDTLLDLANYCILELLERKLEFKEGDK